MNDELIALQKRLRVLEDRAELRELVARYGVAVDDRDIAALEELFTPDGSFRSVDGVMNAVGRDAVIEQFHGRFAALQATNHIAHEQILDFADDPDAAEGLVTSHAEVCRHGRTFVAALRYRDRYRRDAGRWRFAERVLSFLYYLPVEEYAEGFAGRARMRAYGDRRPADYPESLPAWRRYHRED